MEDVVEYKIKKSKKPDRRPSRYPLAELKMDEFFEVGYTDASDHYHKRNSIMTICKALQFRKTNPVTIKITISKMYDEKTGEPLNKLKVKRIA